MAKNEGLTIYDLQPGMNIARPDGSGGGKIEEVRGGKVTFISALAGLRVTAAMRFLEDYRIVKDAEEERASQ